MTLISHHSELTIQDLVHRYAHRELNLQPAFQRQSVWSERDRRQLVLSVLDGLPLPTIYLYRNTGRGGSTRYDVIDGKQRIETLLLFMNKGPLAKEHDGLWVQGDFDGRGMDWWLWKHLSPSQKNLYRTTKIHTIEVEGELSEIIELFVRINSTGQKLTAAERRNAQYFTQPALKAAQALADDLAPWFRKHGVLADSQMRRSRHVELICELLLSVHAGAPLNRKSSIDDLIGGGGLHAADIKEATAAVRRALKVAGVILPDLKATRFHQVADFYTLTLLLHRLWCDGYAISAHAGARNELAGALLRDFGAGVDEVVELQRKVKQPPPIFDPHREYLLTVREATDSYQQRNRREKVLRDVLAGVFDELDTTRAFNKTQKRLLWHAAKKKQCGVCKVALRWDEVHVDHVTAFVKGGRTDLRNARLLCRRCNLQKGAK
jgi:hypothetical protein